MTPETAGRLKKPTLYSIQYLRAAAAAATVLHHSELAHTEIGESGVDLFFIISGFIMALVCRPTTRPLTFLTLRFWRIYPLWWLITLVTIWAQSVPPWSSVTSSMLLWPSEMPIVFQGWTLQIEVFFYSLIAAGLWCAPRFVMSLVSVVLCVLAVAGLVFMPVLLIGIVAGAIALQLPLPRPDDHWRVAYWGAPYALLIWAVLGLETSDKVPHWPWLRMLGDASYSLYLVHTLVLPLFKPWAWGFPAPAVILAMLVACEVVSVVLYLAVERNLLRFGHRVAALLDAAQRAGSAGRRPA